MVACFACCRTGVNRQTGRFSKPNRLHEKEVEMPGCCGHENQIGRRGFIKLSALAGAVATIPVACGELKPTDGSTATVGGEEIKGVFKSSPAGNKRNLLFLTNMQQRYESLFGKIREIKDYDITVSPIQVSLQTNAETVNPNQLKEADVIVIAQSLSSAGRIAATMPEVNSPVIIFPMNFDFIMLDADVAAQFRETGINAQLANSEDHLLDLIKMAVAPRILEGKKALIFGRPFDSTSIPTGGRGEDYIYQRTGLSLKYRPIDELKDRLESVSDADAQAEMEHWKREATEITETTDRAILDSCRLYLLLHSIIDEEKLDGISIDCLSFSFDNNPMLPYPCLPFTRLRDEGYAVPCEAEVCGMLASMVLQTISKRPSYFCNISEAKERSSTVLLRHCVSPLKVMGYDAPAMPYRLRDYHGFGRGATAEIQFPAGVDVTLGGFSKDLQEFMLWPGRIVSRVRDTDAPSDMFRNTDSKIRKYCTNHLEIKIKDMNSFIQEIAGCHGVMVTGNYRNQVYDAMARMNVRVIGPSDPPA